MQVISLNLSRRGWYLLLEPGIYIQEENLGIRLEDNIVIQKDGVINMMKDIPLDAEEVETLMNEQLSKGKLLGSFSTNG